MRIWHLAVVSVMALALAACEQKQAEPTAHTDTNPPVTAEKPPPVTMDPYATDPYASDATAQPRDSGAARKPAGSGKESTLIAGKGEQRTHVVQKGDTLSSLARKYYNDQKRWKDIWEANRSVVPDKDRLAVGTKLVVP